MKPLLRCAACKIYASNPHKCPQCGKQRTGSEEKYPKRAA